MLQQALKEWKNSRGNVGLDFTVENTVTPYKTIFRVIEFYLLKDYHGIKDYCLPGTTGELAWINFRKVSDKIIA